MTDSMMEYEDTPSGDDEAESRTEPESRERRVRLSRGRRKYKSDADDDSRKLMDPVVLLSLSLMCFL